MTEGRTTDDAPTMATITYLDIKACQQQCVTWTEVGVHLNEARAPFPLFKCSCLTAWAVQHRIKVELVATSNWWSSANGADARVTRCPWH